MMVKSLIDMSRPHMLYASGLGIIMLVSLATSNIPALALSQYFEFLYRREICATLFLLGSFSGAFSIQRHLERSKQPWKVPQSQVSIPYAVFFIATLTAVLIAR